MTAPEIRLSDRLARSGHFHTPARTVPPVAARRWPASPTPRDDGRHAPGRDARFTGAARVRAPQSPVLGAVDALGRATAGDFAVAVLVGGSAVTVGLALAVRALLAAAFGGAA